MNTAGRRRDTPGEKHHAFYKEHLAVVAICLLVIGILLQLCPNIFLPRIDKVNRISRVEHELNCLMIAVREYSRICGHLPSSNGFVLDAKIAAALGGENPQGTVYFEFKPGYREKGFVEDPWGCPYFFARALDGRVRVGSQWIPGAYAIWSGGPDRENNFGKGDDIVAWKQPAGAGNETDDGTEGAPHSSIEFPEVSGSGNWTAAGSD